MKCLWKNEKWVEVDEEWLNCVDDINKIEYVEFFIVPKGEMLKVFYKNGSQYIYENVHGTWGNPILIK